MYELETQKLLQIIADKNDISVEKVASEIETSIISAYENPSRMAKAVPRKNDIPTLDEIVDFISNIIKMTIDS